MCLIIRNSQKTFLNTTIENRDCDPFTVMKKHPVFCVEFLLLERENVVYFYELECVTIAAVDCSV